MSVYGEDVFIHLPHVVEGTENNFFLRPPTLKPRVSQRVCLPPSHHGVRWDSNSRSVVVGQVGGRDEEELLGVDALP